jgi:hypothetical protein
MRAPRVCGRACACACVGGGVQGRRRGARDVRAVRVRGGACVVARARGTHREKCARGRTRKHKKQHTPSTAPLWLLLRRNARRNTHARTLSPRRYDAAPRRRACAVRRRARKHAAPQLFPCGADAHTGRSRARLQLLRARRSRRIRARARLCAPGLEGQHGQRHCDTEGGGGEEVCASAPARVGRSAKQSPLRCHGRSPRGPKGHHPLPSAPLPQQQQRQRTQADAREGGGSSRGKYLCCAGARAHEREHMPA